MSVLPSLLHVADAVRETVRAVLPEFLAAVEVAEKADGSLVTAADLRLQQQLRHVLANRWPQTVLLGEEMPEDEQATALAASRPVWLLDPLDGTSNFASGLPLFCVSLALLVEGRVCLGVVYDPVRNEVFAAERGGGVHLNGRPLRPRSIPTTLDQALAIVDFKRLSPERALQLTRNPPFRSLRSIGSAALEWCWVAAGRGHVYLHGRQRPWDHAAGQLILSEAEGRSTTLSGWEPQRMSLEPRSVVAASSPALFEEWTRWLGVRPPGNADRTGAA